MRKMNVVPSLLVGMLLAAPAVWAQGNTSGGSVPAAPAQGSEVKSDVQKDKAALKDAKEELRAKLDQINKEEKEAFAAAKTSQEKKEIKKKYRQERKEAKEHFRQTRQEIRKEMLRDRKTGK